MTTAQTSSWWRRNRWGMMLLPVALVVALAAGSSRIHAYWWVRGFHAQAPVTDGVASLTDEYDDGHLRYPIEARFRVASFAPAPDVTLDNDDPLPDGLRAWRLRFAVEADPDIVLSGCSVAVVDSAGNVIREDDSGLGLNQFNVSRCVPEDTPGPGVDVGSTDPPKLDDGESPRPRTFTTDTVFVLPEESTPRAVRLWYFLPNYVELPVSGSSD